MKSAARREFLQLWAGAAALALPRRTMAQSAPTATTLTDTITLITGAGNNVIALAGGNGTLLVDAGDASHAADVVRVTGNVSIVFNTHYHLESTGGNDVMSQTAATIVAHLNTKLWMTQEIIRDWEGGKVYRPRAQAALPTQAFRANAPRPAPYPIDADDDRCL